MQIIVFESTSVILKPKGLTACFHIDTKLSNTYESAPKKKTFLRSGTGE